MKSNAQKNARLTSEEKGWAFFIFSANKFIRGENAPTQVGVNKGQKRDYLNHGEQHDK